MCNVVYKKLQQEHQSIGVECRKQNCINVQNKVIILLFLMHIQSNKMTVCYFSDI